MAVLGEPEVVELGIAARRQHLDSAGAGPAGRAGRADRCRGRRLPRPRAGQADAREGHEVAVQVRGQVDRHAVGRKDRGAEARRRLVRRERRFAARLQVDDRDVLVAALPDPRDQGEAAVAADAGQPGGTAAGRHPPPGAGRHLVGEGVERGGVGPVGRQQQQTAVVAEAGQQVVRLAGSLRGADPRELLAVGPHQVDLGVHAAARGQGERQEAAVGRPLHLANLVFEAGHPLRPDAVGSHRPYLRHAALVRDEGEAQAVGREARRPAAADAGHPRHLGVQT